VEHDEDDYQQIGEQGRAAIQAGVVVALLLGLWALWGDFVPDAALLEDIELPLVHSKIVDGIVRQVPVTLSDLALALVVLAGVLFLARNLGGLLGFTLLERRRFDAGAGYAIVTLCQYLVAPAEGTCSAVAQVLFMTPLLGSPRPLNRRKSADNYGNRAYATVRNFGLESLGTRRFVVRAARSINARWSLVRNRLAEPYRSGCR
jgi:hypothetical protein